MSPLTDANKIEPPDAGQPQTWKPSDLSTDTASTSSSGEESENTPSQKRGPPAKIKLILPKMPETLVADTTTARRPLRTNRTLTERATTSSTNVESSSGKKSNRQKMLPPKSSNPLTAGEKAPLQRGSKNKVTGPRRGSFQGQSIASPTPDLSPKDSAPKSDTGLADDPIDVDALPSPPPQAPHRFVNLSAGYYQPIPLPYKPSRAKLPGKLYTPNGAQILAGKVSGHQSDAVYMRYMNSKNAPAPPGFSSNCAKLSADLYNGRNLSGRLGPSVEKHPGHSFEHGYVSGPQAGQQYAISCKQVSINPCSHMIEKRTVPVFPLLDEEHLRQRTMQFVLNDSRRKPHEHRFFEDVDETSSWEHEEMAKLPKKRKRRSSSTDDPATPIQQSDEISANTPSTGASEENMFDRSLELTDLVEHTKLLNEMLVAYARSGDQKGMRRDIAMLATVAEKRLAMWISGENKVYKDTQQRINSAATPFPNTGNLDDGMKRVAELAREAAEEQEKHKDDPIRDYLASDSKFWADKMDQEGAVVDKRAPRKKRVSWRKKKGGDGRPDSVLEAGDGATTGSDESVPKEMA